MESRYYRNNYIGEYAKFSGASRLRFSADLMRLYKGASCMDYLIGDGCIVLKSNPLGDLAITGMHSGPGYAQLYIRRYYEMTDVPTHRMRAECVNGDTIIVHLDEEFTPIKLGKKRSKCRGIPGRYAVKE